MQDLTTGRFREIDPGEAETLRRIFGAGNRDVPIFAVGDEFEIRNAHFRVLALDGHLLVLQGIPAPVNGIIRERQGLDSVEREVAAYPPFERDADR